MGLASRRCGQEMRVESEPQTVQVQLAQRPTSNALELLHRLLRTHDGVRRRVGGACPQPSDRPAQGVLRAGGAGRPRR